MQSWDSACMLPHSSNTQLGKPLLVWQRLCFTLRGLPLDRQEVKLIAVHRNDSPSGDGAACLRTAEQSLARVCTSLTPCDLQQKQSLE